MSRCTPFLFVFCVTAIAACSPGSETEGADTGPFTFRDGGPGGGDGSDDTGTGAGTDSGLPMDMGESCDGVDNDGDGVIDETCSCTLSGTQACWPGTPTRRGVGACRDGVQHCEPFGEFYAWGRCDGAVLPTTEIMGDGIDQDCDGTDPVPTGCLPSEFGESCGDGLDQDCDGLVDCADTDCACTGCIPSEFGENCLNGLDDDCDGLVDCSDDSCAAECAPAPPPPGCIPQFPFLVEIFCGDRVDNDCDGRVDCDDRDCKTPGQCGCEPRETHCTDRMDEDCDRSTDCADTDCQLCAPGSIRYCDDPMYCHWGQELCQPDGHWGACIETDARPGDCSGLAYSASCCTGAGVCCENYPHDHSSIGTCDGVVVSCGGGEPPPPPPPPPGA